VFVSVSIEWSVHEVSNPYSSVCSSILRRDFVGSEPDGWLVMGAKLDGNGVGSGVGWIVCGDVGNGVCFAVGIGLAGWRVVGAEVVGYVGFGLNVRNEGLLVGHWVGI